MWIVHTLLGIDTPQPALDFERTAFPAISIFSSGTFATTLSTDAQDVPGIDGSFGDVVSGPHAIAFTHDGALALVVDTNSEDVLAVSSARVEAALARPLPGHMPEGIAIAPDDSVAYIDERNTGDVAIVDIVRTARRRLARSPARAIARLATDPMPAQLRLGQHLFYSANSDEYPITQNHWIACATCHMEGRSDEVTWLFAQGPRDTPSNAGGMLGTGFLFRTADRTQVQDYWHTVNVEQGGAFDPVAQASAARCDRGVCRSRDSAADPADRRPGEGRARRDDLRARRCRLLGLPQRRHASPTRAPATRRSISRARSCCTTSAPATPATSRTKTSRATRAPRACSTRRRSTGVWSSPPYFHDGRAATCTTRSR